MFPRFVLLCLIHPSMKHDGKTGVHARLTREAVEMHNTICCSKEQRVKVYTPSGIQIGLPGMGQGHERLTFPRHFLVGDALNQEGVWICESTTTESEELPAGFSPVAQKWWSIFEGFKPRSLIHENGCVALDDHPMGAVGSILLAIEQKHIPEFEDKVCADVDSVATPGTPSSIAST